MKLKIGMLAASTMLLSQVALAQTLQGTYLFTYVETCQATFSWNTDPSTGDINMLNTVDDGKISDTTGTAVFDSTTRKQKFAYSTSAKTFKLDGNNFHAAYSPTTGIVTSMVFGGLDSSKANCAVTGTATLATPTP